MMTTARMTHERRIGMRRLIQRRGPTWPSVDKRSRSIRQFSIPLGQLNTNPPGLGTSVAVCFPVRCRFDAPLSGNPHMPATLKFLPLTAAALMLILFGIPLPTVRAADDGVRYLNPSKSDGSSAAVIVPEGPLVHTAQFLAVSSLGEIVGKGRPREQIDVVLESINGALRLSNPTENPVVVKLNVVTATLDVANEVRRTLAEVYSGREKPAVSYVVGELRR